ncbi:TonB-dependent receptor [Chitinophaga sp. XS-30]|uniref:TonB-dependent receptor n=1 Tax=Chitinophaga sp. XS-30 TaxID=2604421 RepID=UPI0011DD7A8A|nr:TonB-dependent receptor [Chitinophaga sp. XS-30]QEH42208.1 TonB-dependent receptor [Chitinophaga sp. XS-30]
MRSFLSILFLMLLSTDGFSLPDYKVTLKAEQVPLKQVLADIEKQTGLYFMYSTSQFKGTEKVSIHVTEAKLEEVLHTLLDARGMKWELKDKAIVLRTADKKNDAAGDHISLLTGIVTNEEGVALPGASVLVKGSKSGTVTDANGNFQIRNVSDGATLLIRYTGYETTEIKVSGQRAFAVKLKASVNGLDETVVVAYGTTTQRSNTGAITVVRGEQIQSLPNRSFDKSLQGLVPGLLVTNGTGQPGGGVSNFVLRGITTGTDAFFGSTVRNPLIVIDGIPVTQDHFQLAISALVTPISNPLSQLNPTDIESITVLKDAAAIALYGSKASNGVILITTKTGQKGKTMFSFRHQTDISSKLKNNAEMVSTDEYLELLYEAYRNTNPTLWTDAAIKKDLLSKFPYRISGNDTSFYPSPNWLEELYVSNAITTSNDISMSGGTDKTKFYVNAEYTKQNGIVKKTGFDRKSIRINFESNPVDFLKIGLNTSLSHTKQDYANPLESFVSASLSDIMSPLNPIRLDDGTYIFNYQWGLPRSSSIFSANPVAAAEHNINRNVSFRGLTKFYGDINFLKYFTLASSIGFDFMLAETKEKIDPRFLSTRRALGGSIQEADIRRTTVINTNTLRYNRTFKNVHSVNAFFGHEAQILEQKKLGGSAQGNAATLPYYDEISSPGYPTNSATGLTTRQTLLSQFGQVNYAYAGKYMLSASLRRDASSVFGSKERWGTYWSVGSGWILSEENFLKQHDKIISSLKLRGSIGVAGSSAPIGNSTRYDLLELRSYQGQVALTPVSFGSQLSGGNPNIKWEKTFTWDAGLEAKLFSGRINLTFDIYNKKTSNLIYKMNLPLTTGNLSLLNNIGDLRNSGTEIAISADLIRRKHLTWNLRADWSSNQNKLIKADVPLTTLTGGLLSNEEGRSFNSFYLKEWAGVNSEDGKPQWIDSTGKTTGNYNQAISSFVGKPSPDAFGSVINTISYMGFSISAHLYYQYGFKLYDWAFSQTYLNDGEYPYIHQVRESLDRWQKPGDKAANPVRKLNNTDGGTRASTRYLFDGDYIRLKNIVISYNFPKRVLEKISLNSLKVFIQGNNLALWSKFPGVDPDNASVGGTVGFSYPNQKSYAFGLNASF